MYITLLTAAKEFNFEVSFKRFLMLFLETRGSFKESARIRSEVLLMSETDINILINILLKI